MEARSQREVKDGSEYESLFPPPDATDITVKKSADKQGNFPSYFKAHL
jgi:hypothetical protein